MNYEIPYRTLERQLIENENKNIIKLKAEKKSYIRLLILIRKYL